MRKDIIDLMLTFNIRLNAFDKDTLGFYYALLLYNERVCRLKRTSLYNKDLDFHMELKKIQDKYLKNYSKGGYGEIKSFEELYDFIKKKTEGVSALLEEFKMTIKKYYVENNIPLYHITPYEGDSLTRSRNSLNQYEREIGDWVFASSADINDNVYRLRVAGSGMIRIDENSYLITGDHVKYSQGNLMLDNDSYIYTLKNDKFLPVVSIGRSRNGYQLLFDNEWTSDKDIHKDDILSREKDINVTEVLNSNNIFSTQDKFILNAIRKPGITIEESRQIISKGIEDNRVIFWNKEIEKDLPELE